MAGLGRGFISNDNQLVACAVAVVVTHGRQTLFGRRRVEPDRFEWQLPGGIIEVGEAPQQAARREVSEETGLTLKELQFVGLTNNVFSQHNHSISLYFEAECEHVGSLSVGESDKCLDWEWKDWSEVSENLFLPLRLFKQTDYQPFLGDRQRTYVSI